MENQLAGHEGAFTYSHDLVIKKCKPTEKQFYELIYNNT